MDEHYLDRLLKQVEEQQHLTPEDLEDTKEIEHLIDEEAGRIQDVALADSEISLEDIGELDSLTKLADLDMDAMDFEDIDFDDMDITSIEPTSAHESMLENEDVWSLSIDEVYLDDEADAQFEEEFAKLKEKEDSSFRESTEPEGAKPEEMNSTSATNIDSTFDLQDLLVEDDSLFFSNEEQQNREMSEELVNSESETEQEYGSTTQEIENLFDQESLMAEFSESTVGGEATPTTDSSSDMDDIFEMLGLDPTQVMESPIAKEEPPDFEIPDELKDLEDISNTSKSSKKKKKSFIDILFEEEEEEPEDPKVVEEKERKKKEKKEAKLKKKEEDKQKKQKENAKKQSQKKASIAAKKAKRDAEEQALKAEEQAEKKLNKPLSVLIVVVFLLLTGGMLAGTFTFDYSLVIVKTRQYFERQKYGMAYRELLGVEVKPQHEELESQVYTVMHMERHLESFGNYQRMNMPEKALDALLQGLVKYHVYYEQADALGVVEDMNLERDKIYTNLELVYGITREEAEQLITLDRGEYIKQVQQFAGEQASNNDEKQTEDVTQ